MNKHLRAIVSLLAVAMALSGCGGGSAALPQTPKTGASPSLVPTVVTLRVDRPITTGSASKRPAYVSPATQSLVYSITDPSGNAVSGGSGYVNLTSASTYCSSPGALQPLTCTVSIPIAIAQTGTYTFDVATYDTQQSAACTPSGAPSCSGVLLSRSDLGETLTLGASNTVSLTLAGVPASISIVPASIMTTTVGSTVSLVGAGAHVFLVQALDAGGNAIVGTGAPSFSIAMTGFSGTLTQPSATSPNLFTVTPPSTYSSAQGTITATATYLSGTDGCAQSGAVCTASVTIGMRELLAVIASGAVELFADGDLQPLASYPATPRNIAFDQNGNLFALTNAKLIEFASPLGSAPVTTSVTRPVTGAPNSFLSDGHGHMVESNGNVGKTIQYSVPLGSSTTFASFGSSATVDGSGNLLVADSNLYEFATDGTMQTITNGMNTAYNIAIRSDGTIGIADNGSNTISLFAPPYTSGASASLSFSDFVVSMAFDSSGKLYLVDQTTKTLDVLTSTLSGVSVSLTPPAWPIEQLVVTGGSHLLVAAGTKVYEYQLPLSSSSVPIAVYPCLVPGVAAYP